MDREGSKQVNLHIQGYLAGIHPKKYHFQRIKSAIIFFTSGILFLINQSGYSQTNLSSLIDYSLKHSHEIKKSNLQAEEAKYGYKEVLGQGLPQIEASGTYSKIMIDKIEIPQSLYSILPSEFSPLLDQLNGINKLYTVSAGVQVTQLIYNQSYLVGLKTSIKAQELYQLLHNKTEEEIIEEVASTYYQVLSLIFQLNTIDKSLLNLSEIYRITDLNYKNDLVKESDVNRLKVTITNLQVNQQTVKNIIDVQLNYLKAIAGMPADTVLSIDTTSLNDDISSLGLTASFSIDNVPAYKVLLKQSELNLQQIKLERSNYYPNLAAFGQFDYSSYNTTSEIKKWNNMNTIGLKLSVPIISSGVKHARVKQAQLEKAQTEETILKTKDLLAVNYSNAFSEYQTAYKLLGVQKENRDLALKVYNQTSSQYKEGMASMADVLNVNSDFLQADNSYNQQILKCKLSEIKMLKSSGNLKRLLINK